MQKLITPDHPLIVVHTPKCGGTSLLASFRKAFGAKNIFVDYRFLDPGRPKAPIGEHSVIYGHLKAQTYSDVTAATWATLLREPVDRLLSIYFAWKFYPMEKLPPERAQKDELRRAVHNGKIDVLDFARLPRFSEAYHRLSHDLRYGIT